MPRYLFNYPKDDNDFRPNQRVPKQLKALKKKKQTKIYNRNGWDQDENKKYREFIQINSQMLENREERREKKVFLRLSEYVKTRDANQCRSHHQKMIQKYKTMGNILEFLRYLEDRSDNVHKDIDSCKFVTQLELPFQLLQDQKPDEIFLFQRDNQSFDDMFKNDSSNHYLNFLEDDIWNY